MIFALRIIFNLKVFPSVLQKEIFSIKENMKTSSRWLLFLFRLLFEWIFNTYTVLPLNMYAYTITNIVNKKFKNKKKGEENKKKLLTWFFFFIYIHNNNYFDCKRRISFCTHSGSFLNIIMFHGLNTFFVSPFEFIIFVILGRKDGNRCVINKKKSFVSLARG